MTAGHILSPDGVRLFHEAHGAGPPLLVVHGTTAERRRWAPVLPFLTPYFTVHALDRRGRGDSGDAADYSIGREIADIAAVATALGPDVAVLGHSFGAICALEAARLTPSITRLTLYEPPLHVDGPPPDDGAPERLDALLAAGDREGVLLEFYGNVLRAPASEIALLRSRPNWPDRLRLAHTIARELRAARDYRLNAAAFSALRIPVQILLGGESPARFGSAAALLQSSLPLAAITVLDGQKHQAIDTAPELFAEAVLRFLRAEGHFSETGQKA